MRSRPFIKFFAGLAVGLASGVLAQDADVQFFENRIRPVLAEHCFSCHSSRSEKLKAGLRVDSRSGLLAGGDTGPAIVPGKPDESLLLRAVSYEDPDLQMPPKTRLPAAAIADLRDWIRAGATWPTNASDPSVAKSSFNLEGRRDAHWAWRRVRRPSVPKVENKAWCRTEVDRFILARLESAAIAPAPDASGLTLLRRLTFALTGLPPSDEQVQSFLKDSSPDAFERMVDELLQSPQFGVRWGRHWLDKVRYAETMGHEFDYPILGSWRYRDYVVRAFNADIGFDRFAREQIAGDLMEDPRHDPATGLNEGILATTQFWFCQQVHSPVDVRIHQAEVIDNQIDVMTKSLLGLTVSCARCHDHKFDAISTRDYYALYGILGSSRYAIREADDRARGEKQFTSLSRLRNELRLALADRVEAGLNSTEPFVAELPGPAEIRAEDSVLPLDDWIADGTAFAFHGDSVGQPSVVGEGDTGIRLMRPGVWNSATLSRRYQGAVRSPTFVIDRDYLHLRVAGRGTRVAVVVEGFTLIRAPIYGDLRHALTKEEPHWLRIDTSLWKGRRAWLELADLSAPDPASTLPDSAMSAEGWGSISQVVASTLREPPASTNVRLELDPRGTLRTWRRAPQSLSNLEIDWLEERLRASASASGPREEEILQRWKAIEKEIKAPVLVASMADGTGQDEAVFVRGNPRTPGEKVPRGFLEALQDDSADLRHSYDEGSGRLALAEAVTDESNPFFTRVAVNWVWAHLFGRGLVSSVDNFGALGEAPSHPELLDWLADDFRRHDYSIKRTIRMLVLSRVWQMTSRAENKEAETSDPENRLLHRANLRRLEGEAIRDALLAVGGNLDPTLEGPSVPIHLTEFMEGRGRPGESGPLDGRGRRSIYIEVRRNFLSPMMMAFDTPVPATTVGIRSVSNVPAQALALLNDPFVKKQARLCAERLLSSDVRSDDDRIQLLYRETFGRHPDSTESLACREFLDAGGANGSAEDQLHAWSELCHVLFNSKEFVFLE